MNGNNEVFFYDAQATPITLPADTSSYVGLQTWIENNNKLVYHLLIEDTEETRNMAIGTKLKLIQQLKEKNRELRLLRYQRVLDKITTKLECAVDALMLNDYDNDAKYIPMYMQLMSSLHEAAEKVDIPVDVQNAIIFDTIQEEATTDLSEASREHIRTAAQELLKLCTKDTTNVDE